MTRRYRNLFLILVLADALMVVALGFAIHSPWFATVDPHLRSHYRYDWTFEVGDHQYGVSGGLGYTEFSSFGSTRTVDFQLHVLVALLSLPLLLAIGAWLRYLSRPDVTEVLPLGWIRRVRKRTLLIWTVAALVFYALSSGPAMCLKRTPLWSLLDIFYLPLSYLCAYTPASKFLIPYWNLWIDQDENPLFLG